MRAFAGARIFVTVGVERRPLDINGGNLRAQLIHAFQFGLSRHNALSVIPLCSLGKELLDLAGVAYRNRPLVGQDKAWRRPATGDSPRIAAAQGITISREELLNRVIVHDSVLRSR